jgi:hypothetical protein
MLPANMVQSTGGTSHVQCCTALPGPTCFKKLLPPPATIYSALSTTALSVQLATTPTYGFTMAQHCKDKVTVQVH